MTVTIAVVDGQWVRIEAPIPAKPRCSRNPGRKRSGDWRTVNGIPFVLHTGVA